MARTVPLKKRVAFLERADAVRRLQQIGRHREASLIKANIENDISRLRGISFTVPHMSAVVLREIERLTRQLRELPRDAGHWGAVR
jgi:hypothetical protein